MKSFDIDGLVRNILADLSVERTRQSARPAAVTEPAMREKDRKTEIYVDSRVVSLTDLKDKLSGATKIFIPPKSVLTPSAKDEIRRRKIEVAVRLANETDPATNGTTLWLALHRPAAISASLSDRLARAFQMEKNVFESLAELIARSQRQLSDPSTFGVALTRQAATALRLANRTDTLRAILGGDPKQTAEDAKELDANLLVIHPARVNETALLDMTNRYLKRK